MIRFPREISIDFFCTTTPHIANIIVSSPHSLMMIQLQFLLPILTIKRIAVRRIMDIVKGFYIDNNFALLQFVPIALIQIIKFLKILSLSCLVIQRIS